MRKRLDEELYAPAGGWEQAERDLMTKIMHAPDPGTPDDDGEV
jgi:hypothetical protein